MDFGFGKFDVDETLFVLEIILLMVVGIFGYWRIFFGYFFVNKVFGYL